MAETITSNKARVQRLNARLQGMHPDDLVALEKAFKRRDVLLEDRVRGRDQSRVDRISEHLERLEKRIAAEPDHPRIDGLRKRVAEYRESLLCFGTYKQEAPPTGNRPGVKLEVPLGRFGIKVEE